MPESNVVPNPSNAINAKDQRKLEACAIKPIIGGPIKKPKKLIEDTIASATPGSIFFDLPARLYTIGTTDDTPIPTNKKPIVAITIFGNKTASINPRKNRNTAQFQNPVHPVLCNIPICYKPPACHRTHE